MSEDINKLRNKIQDEGVTEWFKTFVGTVILPTGLGKTFVLFKILKKLLDEKYLSEGDHILFTAERTIRNESFKENAKKFESYFGFNPYKTFDIEYLVYNTARTLKNNHYKFVLCDETHDSMTPENIKFFENNTMDMILGLTATPKDHIKYGRITKKIFFDKYCPIIFRMSMKQSYKMGLHREVKLYRFNSFLTTAKNLKVGSGSNTWFDSELNSYMYWTSRIEQLRQDNYPNPAPGYAKELMSLYLLRKRILWNAPSKGDIYLKYILPRLGEKKTLVFANSLELLKKCQITHIVSSKNSKKVNMEYIDMFNQGKINILGSYKVIEQGENLEEFDNMVLLSYDSQTDQFVQRIGRARWSENPLNLIITCINDTGETEVVDSVVSKLKLKSTTTYDIDNK